MKEKVLENQEGNQIKIKMPINNNIFMNQMGMGMGMGMNQSMNPMNNGMRIFTGMIAPPRE